MQVTNRFSITSSGLKLIAFITMIIDHVGVVLVLSYLRRQGISPSDSMLYQYCRIIGRIAFPLFVFMIAEGMYRTKSRPKYLLRLLLLALISEPAFDLAIYSKPWNPNSQNVIFSLLGAAFLIYIVDIIKNRIKSIKLSILLRSLTALGICIAVFLLCTDYAFVAPLLALCFYELRWRPRLMYPLAAILIAASYTLYSTLHYLYPVNQMANFSLQSILSSTLTELYATLALPLVYLYQGKRGFRWPKPAYYLIYPGHLLLLYLISLLIH